MNLTPFYMTPFFVDAGQTDLWLAEVRMDVHRHL